MTDRPKVQSENDLHSSMYAKEILGGTARGSAAGAALGALLKHTGHKVGPGALASAGAILGGIHGGLKGRERSLRDTVTQQRMHQRAEARKKPHTETKEAMDQYEIRKWASFSDELGKQANLLASMGQGVVRGGVNLAGKLSPLLGEGAARMASQGVNATRGLLGAGATRGVARNAFNTAVGAVTIGLGARGAMAAGRALFNPGQR